MQTPILSAIDALGASELARHLGVSVSLVSQWAHGRRPVAAHHCIPIEQATEGKVTRYELRPDVFGHLSHDS